MPGDKASTAESIAKFGRGQRNLAGAWMFRQVDVGGIEGGLQAQLGTGK